MVAFDNQKIGPKEQFAANHFQGIILDMIISFCFPIGTSDEKQRNRANQHDPEFMFLEILCRALGLV